MTERLHFHFSLSCIGEGNGNPLQCSCLENPRDGGAWWAAVYGVARSRTWLKRLSSSSSCLDSSPGKESTCNVGDLDLIPELGRSPGERKVYPLQYLGLENSINCIVHGVTNSGTWLKKFHFTPPLEMCHLCMVLKMCSNIFQYL